MIATCGHKVFEGISCSLKLSEKEWSYGTYCADCLKSYFDNNEIDNESEVVKLLQELAKLKEENEKLKAELFNQKEHYEVLKENYDNVFIFMAEKTDRTISECFDRYKDWLVK